jgi:hypothetical protein
VNVHPAAALPKQRSIFETARIPTSAKFLD